MSVTADGDLESLEGKMQFIVQKVEEGRPEADSAAAARAVAKPSSFRKSGSGRGSPTTGQPHGFRGDVASVAKRNCAQEKYSTVKAAIPGMGQTDAGGRELGAGALPIGLAHRVKLKNDVAHGAVVKWSDVEVDADNETVRTRREMEVRFGGGR